MEIIFIFIYFTVVTLFIIWKSFEEKQSEEQWTHTLRQIHHSLQELALTYENKQHSHMLDHIKENMKILSQMQEQFLNTLLQTQNSMIKKINSCRLSSRSLNYSYRELSFDNELKFQ
ncbi:unnamed protein product [Paramecium primaurelia]|uniref:Uncharacterized protein n=1 Tax=Paramecium primaurelia TaxID=5886 RepID=A0A8S1P2V7_PARPR|nr:unnamed protein product [Paramecium primaurelia]